MPRVKSNYIIGGVRICPQCQRPDGEVTFNGSPNILGEPGRYLVCNTCQVAKRVQRQRAYYKRHHDRIRERENARVRAIDPQKKRDYQRKKYYRNWEWIQAYKKQWKLDRLKTLYSLDAPIGRRGTNGFGVERNGYDKTADKQAVNPEEIFHYNYVYDSVSEWMDKLDTQDKILMTTYSESLDIEDAAQEASLCVAEAMSRIEALQAKALKEIQITT